MFTLLLLLATEIYEVEPSFFTRWFVPFITFDSVLALLLLS
jgi:hypothetical protein